MLTIQPAMVILLISHIVVTLLCILNNGNVASPNMVLYHYIALPCYLAISTQVLVALFIKRPNDLLSGWKSLI